MHVVGHRANQWLAASDPISLGSPLRLPLSLAGIAINTDWNASDDEEEETNGTEGGDEAWRQGSTHAARLGSRDADEAHSDAAGDAALLDAGSRPQQSAHIPAAANETGDLAREETDALQQPAAKRSIFDLGRFRGKHRGGAEVGDKTASSRTDSTAGTGQDAGQVGAQDEALVNEALVNEALVGPDVEAGQTETLGLSLESEGSDGSDDNPWARAESMEVEPWAHTSLGSTNDEADRWSAFLHDSEIVVGRHKASRVQGLDLVPATLVLCRTKTDGAHVKAVYLIDDGAMERMEAVRQDADMLSLAEAGGEDMSFRHVNEVAPGVRKWEDCKTAKVLRQSWLQQPLALEFYHVRGGSTLMVLSHAEERDQVVADLSGGMYGNLGPMRQRWLIEASGLSSARGSGWRVQTRKMLSDSRKQLVKKWTSGLVSNFEFLMHLNLLAGRSTQDLSRYPVFPWVLADYTSETLDLNDPATFRDLSKPMGCQDERRRRAFEQRFDEWDQDENECPPFHYGTHYSTSAHVLYYLVRLEPFTSMHKKLQSGRFDEADRLFHDVAECWHATSSNSNMTEVKELIPEMFYLPEMFENQSGLDLGRRQDGQVVDHVKLPPWAHGDVGEFVRLHRAALESVHVSANLHKWIDLVFGYKQRGRFAVEAVNVFHYLTYQGAIDVCGITDETQRQAVLSQIGHFGQCPQQVFQRPHPARVTTPGYSAIANPELLNPIQVKVGMMVGDVLTQNEKVLAIGYGSILLRPSGEICLIPDIRHPGCVSVVVTESKKTVGLMQGLHAGLVTAMAVTGDSSVLATGGQDGVVRLWDIAHQAWFTLPPRPLGRNGDGLIGHRAAVVALALSRSQGIAVSGSEDGSAIMWDLARCTSLQVLRGHPEAVVGVAIDDENGAVLTCSASLMKAWSVNGELLASLQRRDCAAFLYDLQSCAARQGSMWTNETIFVTGHSDGHIAFWKLIPSARAHREGAIAQHVAPQTEASHARVLAPMWVLDGGAEAVTVLRFSSDCRELVSGHERGTCNVWRISESAPMMQQVDQIMEQDPMILAFAQALARASGLTPTSRTKCLTRQAALDVLRTAANPCVPYTPHSNAGSGGRGVYVALSMQGYLQRAPLALARVDLSGRLEEEWREWLAQFTGTWAQFWSACEAFLAARIPALPPTWLDDEAQVIGRCLLKPPAAP